MRLFWQGRIAIAFCGAMLLAGALASSAAATVTIGQLATGPDPNSNCSGSSTVTEYVQPTVTSGSAFVVPPNGAKITSWSTQANLSMGGQTQGMTMKVYRPLAGLSFQVVGHDGPFALTRGQVNTFATNVAVQPGDVLGLAAPAPFGSVTCGFPAPGEQFLQSISDAGDGASVTFAPLMAALRANISAQVALKASNDIELGKLKRNKQNGTATLTVKVPGPGKLTLTGTGVKAQRPATASASKTATAAGTVELRIKAKGKKKTKLEDAGKVKVKAKVSFAPSGSDIAVAPGVESKRVKLIDKG